MPRPKNGKWGYGKSKYHKDGSFHVLREYIDPMSGKTIQVMDSVSETIKDFCAKRGIRIPT